MPNEWHKRSAELNPKYKSALCKSFMEQGPSACKFGDGCVFAHGEHELRTAAPEDPIVPTTKARRRQRGGRASKGSRPQPEPEQRTVQFQDEAHCIECSTGGGSRPVTPVHDEPEPLPEWANDEAALPDQPYTGLARSDSILAADSLFLDDTIDTTTIGDAVVFGEAVSPTSQLASRFAFATVTPRELPSQWRPSQVSQWVTSRDIPQETAQRFIDHEIDGECLLEMTRDDLREMGITSMGHLVKLGKGIAELKSQTTTPDETAATTVAVNTETSTRDVTAPLPTPTPTETKPEMNLKDLARWESLAPQPLHALASVVGPSQLISEAADAIRSADNVSALNTVLQAAVMANKIAEVIRSDGRSLTLCMLAAKYGRLRCLQRLLRELAAQESVNTTRIEDGCSALHLAAYSGSVRCAQMLLEAGADTSLINRYAETAEDCAAKQGHVELSQILKSSSSGSIGSTGPIEMMARQLSSSPPKGSASGSFAKIYQPRRHTKKRRDLLASELLAWRSGGTDKHSQPQVESQGHRARAQHSMAGRGGYRGAASAA